MLEAQIERLSSLMMAGEAENSAEAARQLRALTMENRCASLQLRLRVAIERRLWQRLLGYW